MRGCTDLSIRFTQLTVLAIQINDEQKYKSYVRKELLNSPNSQNFKDILLMISDFAWTYRTSNSRLSALAIYDACVAGNGITI